MSISGNAVKHCNDEFFPSSSAGKEFACNAGDPGSIPGSGRSLEEVIDYPLRYSWGFLVTQMANNPLAKQGDLDLILGLGSSPGGGHRNPLQYSCLENPNGWRSLVGCRVGHD